MILIADSGATTTTWCALDRGNVVARFESEGYNPNYITLDYMVADIRKALPADFEPRAVDHVYFYGAGVTELQYGFVREAIAQVMPNAETFVAMDLLASARALLGRKAGFAAILGTGTNSCLYDGERITLNIDSLGFILGDEGSGGNLGKRMITDYIRRNMPPKVYELVGRELGRNNDELLDVIYTKPFPNRFCAQYAKFINEHLDFDPYFPNLVTDAFRQFFLLIVTHYPDYQKYTFNAVGSVAYYFRPLLEKVVEEFGMKMGTILKAPMDGLIRYHLNN